MRVVLTGGTGILGSAFRSGLAGFEVVPLDRAALDVSRPQELRSRLEMLRPSVLINCAADTDVERAEENSDRCWAANALLPELLASGCRRIDATLVHFSSTGCYGGTALAPHDDYAPLTPTSVHHRAKAAGEAAVRENGLHSLILRLGWLYGGAIGQPKNFVWARILEARRSPEMVSDPYQIGTPTYVDDVVRQTLLLIVQGMTGTYNCVAGGAASRYDYVSRIVADAGLQTRLLPCRFVRKAPVAANESAVNAKLEMLGLNVMPRWEESLVAYVKKLLSAETSS